jgi:methylenetetrahydrofolate reductase (NADPH)
VQPVSARGQDGGGAAPIGRLVADARLEVIPMGGVEDRVRTFLPVGSSITVTCSPGKGPDRTIDLAERLHAAGYMVLPHVSARTVRSVGHLEEILGRVAAAGLGQLFVIGGDGSEPLGPYASAVELLAAIAEAPNPPGEIGIGGYPEGHPLIDDDTLMRALAAKQPYATHIATQICFDPVRIAKWIRVIRAADITLPIFVGMAGAVNRRRLIEVSLRVGVGPSVKFVSKHGSLVSRLMRRGGYRPDEFVTRMAPFAARREYGIRGLHVFSFNQVESTQQWRERVADAYEGAARPFRNADEERGTAS